jgi:hypothetical protein
VGSNNFDYPSNMPVVDPQQLLVTGIWNQVFQRWHNVIISAQQSGPTAQRPTTILWIGRRFYDTTLNKPVYLSAVKPSVWRDGTGAVV